MGECLVKFYQNPQGPRLLINEFIGYSLADALSVAHPPGGLAQIDAALLPHGGKLELPETPSFDPSTFEAGLHFYSQYLSPVDRVTPDDLRNFNAPNMDTFAGVVVLDLLLGNYDRSPGNMNVLLHREGSAQRLKVIDFGHAFGGGEIWGIGNLRDTDLPTLSKPLPYADVLEPYLTALSRPEQSFASLIERLVTIKRDDLNAIITAIPNDWYMTQEERDALLNYLSRRVQALPDYLAERLKKDVWWQ